MGQIMAGQAELRRGTAELERNDAAPARADDRAPRSIVILGATGSIGKSTADIIAGSKGAFTVAAVAGGRDPIALARVARDLGARFAALADPSGYAELKAALAGTDIKAAAGPAAVVEAALHPSDMVMAAIAGTAGSRADLCRALGRPHGGARQQGMSRLRRAGLHPPGRGDGHEASAGRQRA